MPVDEEESRSMFDSPQSGSLLEEESSISDPLIRFIVEHEMTGPPETTYSLVENGTKRRGMKLVDSNDYAYNVKRRCIIAMD